MIGQTISERYRIVAKLGQGAMGTVWKAEDVTLGRFVALKFLPQSLAESAAEKERLLQEARTASRLDHPGIATILDVSESDGQPFIALQCVEGETVRARMRRGPMAIQECLRIAIAVTESLGHAL